MTKPNTPSLFFRQLHTPIDTKAEALADQIAALNRGEQPADVFIGDLANFALITGSTFAYWVGDNVFQLFVKFPKVEYGERVARIGDHPGNKDRYVRLIWEVSAIERSKTRQWLPYQKGGYFSPFYADTHLVVDWDLERETYFDFYGRPGRASEHPSNYKFFFRPGLNWPLRTQKGFNLRAMPEGCIISNKSPTVFVPKDEPSDLLKLLALMNSTAFKKLVEMQMAFGSYEVGVIQRTPIPTMDDAKTSALLASLALEAHNLTRDFDRTDETTHVFCLPGLAQPRAGSLLEASLALAAEAQAAQARLAAIQAEIDELVLALYGLDEADLERADVKRNDVKRNEDEAKESGYALRFTFSEPSDAGEEDDEVTPPDDLPARVQNLLMWCVGVAFGRWDGRLALDPSLLPALPGPFDPLPRCAPGALVGPAGLPPTPDSIASEAWLRARQNVLDLPTLSSDTPAAIHHSQFIIHNSPFPLPWDGILVDDPTHPSDLVGRVRQVIDRLWPARADAIEAEACAILGFNSLRDYFRDPRQGFFAFHIKRYSKSRRKAPIYWLLQSERRSYALWLYYPRLTPMSYFVAGRDYADAKVKLEETRLAELRQGLAALEGSPRRKREREIERQQKLVNEVTDFRNRLDAVALAKLPPDPNDGVLISLAPLRELVPWKEAEKTWRQLLAGQYAWSTMARQLRDQGKVNQ